MRRAFVASILVSALMALGSALQASDLPTLRSVAIGMQILGMTQVMYWFGYATGTRA